MSETPRYYPWFVAIWLMLAFLMLAEHVGCYYQLDGQRHHIQLGSGVGLFK